jgi:AcrR family transcriptional regulator
MSRRAGLTPDRVVELGLAILDREGPDGLTLARVAEAAGVATPSLYKHVAGLPDLRGRIAIRALVELTGRVRAAAVGVSGDSAVRAFAAAYRDYLRDYPARAGLLVTPVPDLAPDQNPVIVMLAILRGGYGLEGSPAIHATRGFRAAVHGFAMLEAAGGFGLPESLDESFDRLIDMITAGLRAYASSAATAAPAKTPPVKSPPRPEGAPVRRR